MITPSPWPLIGHHRAVAQLAQAVATGEVAHAYLVSGPAQIGKQTLARTFAQALLCTDGRTRPCGRCRACHLVGESHHPDFLVLDMAWQEANLPDKRSAQSISVDAVRQINAELARRPHEGAWKVLLVPNAEELTLQAANAFLKTLEEPPAFVVILLTTRDPELVLPTIRSRCQFVPLAPLPSEQVEQALRARWGVAQEKARLLARLSEGRVGWAVEAAQEPAALEVRQRALEELRLAIRSHRAARLVQAATLEAEADRARLRFWAGWWRDVLLLQNQAGETLVNEDERAELEQAARLFSGEQVRGFLRELQRLVRLLNETNVNRQLLWEVLLLKLPVST